ncbi:MAG: pyridoxamine 5'-phosphate oxidase family protein [Clostridiales Family XIII bacterium]|jgi:uncharacterized pyridoxamine 5'-phosphate oxidase family protein|nr:pyridoxamine 5'-phosphate oxidase family protein [Clostridiales Family XIII bacterium]
MSVTTKVKDFLLGKTFYVATVEGDAPKVRPFGLVFEFEGKLYFSTNESKPSYAQLKANPKVEISATDAENNWIRVSGEAVFDQRDVIKEEIFKVSPHLKDLYGQPDSPILAPFYIANGNVTWASLAAPATEEVLS